MGVRNIEWFDCNLNYSPTVVGRSILGAGRVLFIDSDVFIDTV